MELLKDKERTKVYNKTTLENEKYTLTIKITKENSIYISIVFENNTNNIFETIKLYDDIKKNKFILKIIYQMKFQMKQLS